MTATAPAPNYKIGNEKLIKVLPNAANRLLGLLRKQGRAENGALRVAVVGGGCSGLQYKMDLVDGPANRATMDECSHLVREAARTIGAEMSPIITAPPRRAQQEEKDT